ncbi:MAG TPA: rhombotarget lipoprotein [Opitutaceae bacterium]
MSCLSRSHFLSLFTFGAAIALIATVSGCFGIQTRHADRTSSIVDFLYPGKTNALAPTGLPVLQLPLRIGVAFVPDGNSRWGVNATISELQRTLLLQRVAHAFAGKEYISSIEIVPPTYLRAGGGFENLEQVRRMLTLDLIALVSYDQIQFTDQNRLSLAYWTVVGAYFIHGNKNDTQTLMEAAVYDVASRQMLFRAAGAGQVTANSTLLQVEEHLRNDSARGLQLATDDLISNLSTQLEAFRMRLKSTPDTVARIERRPGYTGSGAVSPGYALAILGLIIWSARRTTQSATP